MPFAARAVIFGVPLLLIILTGIAGYAYSQIVSLSLPIPQALGLFTILLPLITGFSTRLTQNLILRSSKTEQSQLNIPVLFVLGFQLIYETVIVTLALTNIIPPNSLNCRLKDQWGALFSAKDEKAIRGIQDRFGCCGLESIKHQAWPFPDKTHTVLSCQETFGRKKACLGEWRQAQQINAGLFLLVALVVFIVKVIAIMFLLTSSSWSKDNSWIQSLNYRNRERRDDGGRRITRGLIDDGENAVGAAGEEVEAYRDDIDRVGEVDGRQEIGPRVEPSGLGFGDGRNVWREREGANTAAA